MKSSKAIGPCKMTTEWICPGKVTVSVCDAPAVVEPSKLPVRPCASSVEGELELEIVIETVSTTAGAVPHMKVAVTGST